MAAAWWASAISPLLSQGDVITDVPLGTVTQPPKFLVRGSLKGGAPGWSETLAASADHDGLAHYLARGRIAAALVLSHDCEIDKPKNNHRVVLAALTPRDRLSADEQDIIFGQRAYHRLPLVEVPSIGDHFADLRCTLFLPFSVVTASKRVASMTNIGTDRLRAQLVAFYTRLDVSKHSSGVPGAAPPEA